MSGERGRWRGRSSNDMGLHVGLQTIGTSPRDSDTGQAIAARPSQPEEKTGQASKKLTVRIKLPAKGPSGGPCQSPLHLAFLGYWACHMHHALFIQSHRPRAWYAGSCGFLGMAAGAY